VITRPRHVEAIAATRASSAFNTATPDAGSLAISLPFSAAIASLVPNAPR
jgi:hypothetical protein